MQPPADNPTPKAAPALVEAICRIAALPEGRPLCQGAKLALLRLRLHAGDDGRAYPTRQTLATELGVSRRQASLYLTELERAGAIVAEARTGGTPTRYRIEIEAIEGTARGKPTAHVPRGKPTTHARGKPTTHHVGSVLPTETSIETERIETNIPPLPPNGGVGEVVKTSDPDPNPDESQEQAPDPAWDFIYGAESAVQYCRLVIGSDPSSAFLACWRSALRSMHRELGADADELHKALVWYLKAEFRPGWPKRPGDVRPEWFQSLVAMYRAKNPEREVCFTSRVYKDGEVIT